MVFCNYNGRGSATRFTAGGHQNILGWGSLPTANCSLSFVLPERERSCCHRLTPTKPPAGCLLCHRFCSSLPFCRLSFLPSSTLVWPWGAQTQTLGLVLELGQA